MTLSEARDWAILVLTALGMVQAVVVVVVGLAILRLTRRFGQRTAPILDAATRTTANLERASRLLSLAATWPVIRGASLGVGLWRGLRVLTRRSKPEKGGKA